MTGKHVVLSPFCMNFLQGFQITHWGTLYTCLHIFRSTDAYSQWEAKWLGEHHCNGHSIKQIQGPYEMGTLGLRDSWT